MCIENDMFKVVNARMFLILFLVSSDVQVLGYDFNLFGPDSLAPIIGPICTIMLISFLLRVTHTPPISLTEKINLLI